MNLQDVENTFKDDNLDMLVYKAYYRTKMCPYTSKCVYGDLCYNAHSDTELRVPLCINFYKRNTCGFKDCDRSHDTKLVELPISLYSNLRAKVIARQECSEINRLRESREKSRKRERDLEKEIDNLRYDLKKSKKNEDNSDMYQYLSDKEIDSLKQENANLLIQLQTKDALINSYVSKIQTVEGQLYLYQQYVQNYLLAANQIQGPQVPQPDSSTSIPILRPMNDRPQTSMNNRQQGPTNILPQAPRITIPSYDTTKNVLHYDSSRDPRLHRK